MRHKLSTNIPFDRMRYYNLIGAMIIQKMRLPASLILQELITPLSFL
jgi:hypothetical protein